MRATDPRSLRTRSNVCSSTNLANLAVPYGLLLALFALSGCLPVVKASADDPHSPEYDALTHAEHLTAGDILASHDLPAPDTPTRRFASLTVLGFITPWNPSGLPRAAAEAKRGRVDIVSPVLYTATPGDGLTYNPADFPPDRLAALAASGARIEPRIHFPPDAWRSPSHLRSVQAAAEADNHTADDNNKSGDDETDQKTLSLPAQIRAQCKRHGFSGVVLEAWHAAVFVSSEPAAATRALCALSQALRRGGLHTTLVLPPYTGAHRAHDVSAAKLRAIGESFSHVLVMTYDHSGPGPGVAGAAPLAPLPWVRAVARFMAREAHLAPKLLLGVPMYGVQFGGTEGDRHVHGQDVLKLLRHSNSNSNSPAAQRALMWDAKAAEHFVLTTSGTQKSVAFIPTRASVAARLQVANEYGCAGVALWEVGQALDHFFNEL